MDWNKIDRSWKEFCDKHTLKLNTKDQHLFPQAMKQTNYSTVELIDGFELHYFYHFYKGDDFKLSNSFKIVVPVESDYAFRIKRNKWIRRLFSSKFLNIESKMTLGKEFIDLYSNLYNSFGRFPDLEIKLGTFETLNNETMKEDEYVFQILTKKNLPEENDSIELFRDTMVKLINIFKEKIRPKEFVLDSSSVN